nr:MAG TPA: hypothetical protein [Caudoviricetes sp.]
MFELRIDSTDAVLSTGCSKGNRLHPCSPGRDIKPSSLIRRTG